MSGIPIYTQSPINAAKASAVTPQTSTAPPPTYTTPTTPAAAPATTTAAPSAYPVARPGASVPASTGTAHQRYAPTATQENNGPPPPQPGAVPTPMSSSKGNLPPPPKAGQSYQSYQAPSAAAPAPMPLPYPAQMAIPPPTNAFGAQPPTSSTATANTPSSAYPVPVQDYGAAPRESIEHPPGYQQNAYASELTNDQRRAQEVTNASSDTSLGLGGFGQSQSEDSTAGTMWDTAKKWAQTAGEKISEGEQQVWRKINKE
ncbi:hypothetical protein PVAG01_01866 [Phlyctema vagabunda]|uniref:Uncharacterized protein n=1 Tax=Phlyctema vagabunda TaxID=108571 RepID=A0ABR4PYB9_9HELO